MPNLTLAKSNIIVPRPPEFKSARFQVKAVDDARYIIEGILNAIGNIDDGDDRTMPGAFKKTLNDSYSRKSAQHLDFLWPYLWDHDPSEPPIGGIFDGDEVKAQGDNPAGLFIKVQLIPDIERARNVYSCFKSQNENNSGSSGLLRQSMGYKTIRSEMVNEKVDGQTIRVRNLLEVQVWEGSACVFPMNELSVVTDVKSTHPTRQRSYFVMPDNFDLEAKDTITGNTSLTIGPRDETWDGGKAEDQIFAYAKKDDDTYDVSKLKQCFMVQRDGDPQLKGSWDYPFCYIVNGKPRISVGAVITIAKAIAGSRGANAPDGLKPKIEKLYGRINKLYPNDNQLSPSWNDDSKGGKGRMERKDFNTLYLTFQAQDALEDWGDLVNTLTQAMMQAMCIGDTPETDMQDALSQFGEAVSTWVDTAVQCGLSDYLSNQYGNGNNVPYVPYSMRVGGYDSMSRRGKPEGKAGARFSQDTMNTLQDHVKALTDMADQHQSQSDQLAAQYKSMVKSHVQALQQKADDLTQLWQSEGQGPAYANGANNDDSSDKSANSNLTTKRREPPQPALARQTPENQPSKDTDPLGEIAELANVYATV